MSRTRGRPCNTYDAVRCGVVQRQVSITDITDNTVSWDGMGWDGMRSESRRGSSGTD